MRAELAASPVRTGPFDRGYARLAELAEGLPDKRHIIHGDLLNRNVLVQGERITAVIDWRNALYGDRLYDAAWLIFWQPWFPHWQSTTHRRTGTALEPARWPATRPAHRLQACLVHIGLDAMACHAYRRWDDLARTASQLTTDLAGRNNACPSDLFRVTSGQMRVLVSRYLVAAAGWSGPMRGDVTVKTAVSTDRADPA